MPKLLARTCSVLLVLAAPICHASDERQTFDVDPGWESYRSRLQPPQPAIVRQKFGYRLSHFAGGKNPGEIGGRVHRDDIRAYYAKPIAPKTLNDHFSASGKFTVTADRGSSGVLIGWFNHQHSHGWRTPHSLAMRIDGNGGEYWVFYEYGTSQWGTHGGGAFEGPRYQTTRTPPYKADGTVHRWKLVYDPRGADGRGMITFQCDGKSWNLPLLQGHRQQGATFDRFGIWNQQTSGRHLTIFFDDLVIDGRRESFDQDPGWIGSRNLAEYTQRVIRPFHNFGFQATHFAGGKPGEIGGIIFRDEAPAYYADRVRPLTLDDELYAAGKITLRSAGADSGVMFGWFNGQQKQVQPRPDHKTPDHKTPDHRRAGPSDLLGIMIEGPSRVGHYLRPVYATTRGNHRSPTHEGTSRERPVIRPDGSVHTWSLHYQPEGADGFGRMTLLFDGRPHHLDLTKAHRRENMRLDRFGLLNIQQGGHHIEVYLDDLRYTK